MAFTDLSQVFSLDDLWNGGDAIIMSNTAMGENRKKFVNSHNLFHNAGEDFSTANLDLEVPPVAGMDFNTPSRRLSTDSFEKSPWHESDSGMSSTMSETGSPAGTDIPSSEVASVLPIIEWPEGEDDLAAYLLGDVSMIDNGPSIDGTLQNHENVCPQQVQLQVQPQTVYNTRARSSASYKNKKVMPQVNHDTNIDVENSDSECSNTGGLSPGRCDASTSRSLNYFQDVMSSSKSKPAVKIVKVLKAPGSSDCCEDDIVKALDEKSRKNAIQAKMNREKKKKYVSGLEKDVEKLSDENKELKEQNDELKKDVGSLEEEVRYLRSVLLNASALSGLLKNINDVSEVRLSASIVGRKRGASTGVLDHSYTVAAGSGEPRAKRARVMRDNPERAGVCLHVSGGDASLEFCAQCSSLARQSQARNGKS